MQWTGRTHSSALAAPAKVIFSWPTHWTSMADIETGDSAIRITSLSDDSLVIDVDGWRTDGTAVEPGLEETVPVDDVVSGHLTRFRVRTGGLNVDSPELDLAGRLGENAVGTSAGYMINESVSLPQATYRVTLQKESLTVYTQFEGAVDVFKRPGETWVVAFDQPTRISFAVRDTSDHPRGTVTAAPTPEGIAAALSTLPAGLRTTTPDRSFPSLQNHPPRIEIGDKTSVPESVSERVPETGIELCVPRSTEALLSVAPLVHYLCASVTVADRDQPVLRAPAIGLERALPPVPELSAAVSDLVERVFWLDCLVRNAGPHGVDLADIERVREAGLDPDLEALYRASPAERLDRYLGLDFASAAEAFPRWQAAAVVEPTVESVTAVPRLAYALAKIHLPANAAVSDRAVGDGSVPPTEPPAIGPGGARVGCRVVSGTPSDPLATTPGALRRFGRPSGDGPLRVVLVGALDERVGDALADRPDLADAGIRIERHRGPTRSELQAVLSKPPGLLYHATEDATPGVQCADGTLSVAELPTPVADVAVLDAPDSMPAASELVGSDRAAAVVARSDGRSEGHVGVDPVRWLSMRARVGDALWLSRRYGETGPAATVVGDAFRQLQVPAKRFPKYYWCQPDLVDDGDGLFSSLQHQGGHQILHTAGEDGVIGLGGTALPNTLSSSGLRKDIMNSPTPIIHDGRTYWHGEGQALLNPLV